MGYLTVGKRMISSLIYVVLGVVAFFIMNRFLGSLDGRLLALSGAIVALGTFLLSTIISIKLRLAQVDWTHIFNHFYSLVFDLLSFIYRVQNAH